MTTSGSHRARVVVLSLGLLGCPSKTPAPAAPERPTRIVSQTVLSDEVLWDLDVGARVAGVSKMADDIAYSPIAGRWPAEVPRVPGTSEALIALQPDLVVIAEFTSTEIKTLLASAGIPTVTLDTFDGFADYRRHVAAMAEAVGDPQAGTALVERFDARLAAVRAPTSAERPTVVSWVSGNVPGTSTTFDEIADAAGLENLARTHGVEGHRAVPLEQVVTWDPQWVVIGCVDRCEQAERDLAASPGWSATTAGRKGQVVAIPSRVLYSTGMTMLDAVELLRERVGGRPE